MRPRYLNLTLLVVALVGALTAYKTSQLLRSARVEHRRILQMAGALQISDPDEVWFVRFRSAVPGEYAWRFYVPPELLGPANDFEDDEQGPEENHFVSRVRFAYSPTGDFVVYTRFLNGWQVKELGPPGLAQFVRKHWSELVVEQAGRPYQQHFNPGTQQTLLRVTVPEHLRQAAARQLGDQLASQHLPVLFEWRVGPYL